MSAHNHPTQAGNQYLNPLRLPRIPICQPSQVQQLAPVTTNRTLAIELAFELGFEVRPEGEVTALRIRVRLAARRRRRTRWPGFYRATAFVMFSASALQGPL